MSNDRQNRISRRQGWASGRDRLSDLKFLSHAVDAAIRAALRRADARRRERDDRTRNRLSTG
jgi:hypothetical protein